MISEETFTVALLEPQLIKWRLELRPMTCAFQSGNGRNDNIGDVVALREVVRIVAQVVLIIAVLVLSFLNRRKERTIGAKGFSRVKAGSLIGGFSCGVDVQ